MPPDVGIDGFPSFPDFTFIFILFSVFFAIALAMTIFYYLFIMRKVAEGKLEPVGFIGGRPIFVRKRGAQAYCPRCGAAVSLGWRYCPSCGYDLSKLRERGQ